MLRWHSGLLHFTCNEDTVGSNPTLSSEKKIKMAKGENAVPRRGKEWWGKRPLRHTPVSEKHGMKFWKRLLHKIERSEGKQEIKRRKDEE